MKTAEAHVQLKPGIIGVRVKIMPPDAYFPDKVTIVVPVQEEERVTVAKPAPAAAPAPAPEPAKEAQKETEPEVQAKEVVDEPKPEETKE
jgi:small subunit ribosomal protein S3